jgi:hypothetical protein
MLHCVLQASRYADIEYNKSNQFCACNGLCTCTWYVTQEALVKWSPSCVCS